MTKPRTLAGAMLAAVLLTGSVAAPATAASQESVAVSSTEAAARPGNGKILYNRISGGLGRLKIKNGNSRDAVVTLVRGRSKAISVYVRARSTASVREVRDGTYTIFFTSGYRFSTSRGRFASAPSYQRFTQKLRFSTTATSSTVWTLTINPVRNGNARTTGVNPRDFPA
ncbi:hypothetical protein ACIBCT_31930 [Streptosporangium sp. NPDC050855]|uniref:hypothetical protein n=1 Tax=Streptosporangium sp. NPDC050855 TaxID=3366194 RepID=UPI0037891FF1